MGAAIRYCRTALATVASVSLFAMMTITFADVVGRYLLSSPLRGAYEMTEYLLPMMVFAVLPLVTERRDHVTTGLFEGAFSGPMITVRQVVIDLVGAISCAYLAWTLSGAYAASRRLGEASQVLSIPKPPVLALMTAMAGISALILLWLAVANVSASRADNPGEQQ